MKSYLLPVLAVFISIGLYAQTPEQLTRVKKETNSKELQRLANIWRQQSEEQKAIAIQAAQQNGWPITIETENNFAEIQRLDETGKPLYYTTTNSDAAITTSTNKLYSGGGLGLSLSGSGMLIGEWDGGGAQVEHIEFNNTGSSRITIKDSPGDYHYHATHVAGTLIGYGYYTHPTLGANSKGMASSASVDSYDWNSDYSEMATAAGSPTNLLISNHSYGYLAGWVWNSNTSSWVWYGDAVEDNLFGYYDSGAAALDGIAVNAPYYLIVKSAGNDRGDGPGTGTPYPDDGPYDCIPGTGNAKNILTVGAVDDVSGGYSGNPNDVDMSSFSSWGPADDGRIKPDICGNGVGVWSAYWDVDDPNTTGYFAGLNGTSMSAPNVTGSLLLIQEHYYDLNAAYMKSATLKALAIQTADECGPNAGPDYMFGWGLLNSESAANVITNRNTSSLITEETYSGTTYSITVTANGTDPLRATLVWTDPAGTTPTYSQDPPDIMLVNDLDMTITGAKTIYYPYKLDKDNPSNAATTGDNDVDNVEQIHIASATNSVYTITITHEGSISGGSQDFSLIVTGIDVAEPAVVTYEPTNVSSTTVTFNGETTSENGHEITELGFVYGENENPDIDNDTKVVVGSGLGTFTEDITGLTINTTYHVRAYATNSSGTAYGDDKDFTTTATTTWDGSSWDGGTPTASIHAVIDGNYTTSGNLECNNLTINSGKTFNVSVNNGVTVNGNFVNNGTFNIKSTSSGIGSLITLGTVTNNGTFNMERYATENAWHYVTSPLAGNTSSVFTGSYLHKWDEITASWIEITSTSEPLSKGIGYSLWSDAKTTLYTFSGAPYTGNQSITMTKTENGTQRVGTNLIGNPFPSSVDWELLDGVGYGAKHTYDGDNETYRTYNSGAGDGSRYIPPGQGFFIVADYTGTFNLGNADRVHRSSDDFVKENNLVTNGLVLESGLENVKDEVWIEFVEDATNNYERKYDAHKFFSPRSDFPQIYTFSNEKELSIDRRPETNRIQLGYRCQTSGTYSIDISQIDGLSQVELEDTKTNKFHNLLAGPYEFDWSVGDTEERFVLHLNATNTQELDLSQVNIYTIGNQIYISQDSDMYYSSAKVINMKGQIVFKTGLEEKNIQRFALNVQKGVYLVQLIGENQTLTEKIIIK